ncbi:hypothetical protein UlMin_009507 [Ulmus minor]
MKFEEKSKLKQEKPEEEISNLFFSIMEGYSDSIIPPLSRFKPFLEQPIVADNDSTSRKRAKRAKDDRTEFLEKEKDRRLKMNESFALLESLVPGLLPKSPQEKIAYETVEYIKCLEERLRMLEKLKETMAARGRLMLPCASKNSSVSVTASGNVAFFGIECPKQHGLVTKILMVFHKHEAEVLAANVAVNNGHLTMSVTAFVNGNGSSAIEEIKREILII